MKLSYCKRLGAGALTATLLLSVPTLAVACFASAAWQAIDAGMPEPVDEAALALEAEVALAEADLLAAFEATAVDRAGLRLVNAQLAKVSADISKQVRVLARVAGTARQRALDQLKLLNERNRDLKSIRTGITRKDLGGKDLRVRLQTLSREVNLLAKINQQNNLLKTGRTPLVRQIAKQRLRVLNEQFKDLTRINSQVDRGILRGDDLLDRLTEYEQNALDVDRRLNRFVSAVTRARDASSVFTFNPDF
jgi:hypothetical protein